MEPAEDLSGFLARMATEPFAWGAADCFGMTAAWVRARRGLDPAAPVRGRYGTAWGALRILRRLGGYVPAGRHLMVAAGLRETDAPRAGDVGLVEHPAAGPVFAVHAGLGWAVKGERGVALVDWPVLVAWRV